LSKERSQNTSKAELERKDILGLQDESNACEKSIRYKKKGIAAHSKKVRDTNKIIIPEVQVEGVCVYSFFNLFTWESYFAVREPCHRNKESCTWSW